MKPRILLLEDDMELGDTLAKFRGQKGTRWYIV